MRVAGSGSASMVGPGVWSAVEKATTALPTAANSVVPSCVAVIAVAPAAALSAPGSSMAPDDLVVSRTRRPVPPAT